jgi:hypothetical protein
MSFWRTGEKPEKAEIEGPGFEHIAFFASLQRIFKKDHGFGYRYFPWKSDTLKKFCYYFHSCNICDKYPGCDAGAIYP